MADISIGNNDNIDIIAVMKLHLLVCDGVFDLGLAALTDTVGLANAMAGSLPQAPAHIELTLVGVRRRIRTAQGLTVPVVTARGVPEPDVVLVPAFGVVRRNPRNFRQPSSSPATSASRSIILPSLWKV